MDVTNAEQRRSRKKGGRVAVMALNGSAFGHSQRRRRGAHGVDQGEFAKFGTVTIR